MSAQRRVCPRGTKSLCQKQLLILLSKVRLCGGRPTRQDRGPGECGLGGVPGRKSFYLRPGTPADAARGGGGRPRSGRGGPERQKPRGCAPASLLFARKQRVSLLSRAGGPLEGLSPAPELLGSCRGPSAQDSPPPRLLAYVRALAILSIRGGGAGGFWTLGSPRGLPQPWLPRPRLGSPAPARSAPPGPARLAGSQPLPLSPGCPCSYLGGQPPPHALLP